MPTANGSDSVVTLYVRVWIETHINLTPKKTGWVTLYVRVWIETGHRLPADRVREVTLYVRVWIETIVTLAIILAW